MRAPRAREQADPPSPPDRRPPRRSGGSSPYTYAASAAGRPAALSRPRVARRGRVRSALALAAAALLALSGALALPATAEAQTAVTLVSNTGQDANSSGTFGTTSPFSQKFDTGNNADGYTLTGVDVVVSQAGGVDFTLRVCSTDSSGQPTSDCTNLTAPSSFPKGTASFTAPANTMLSSGMTYVMILTTVSGSNRVETTSSNDEDSGKAAEWSIADTSSAGSAVLLIAIKGYNTPSANTAPVFSGTATTRTVPENSDAGTSVGAAVTATDADDDTLTYSLEGTDAASFDIDSGTGQIKTKSGVTYNHEATKNSYSVTVKASDSTDSDTITVTISVTDVAEQPSKPSAPTLAQVTGSATSLTASWSAPGLNGGPALTGYEVRYRAGSTGTWTSPTSHSGTTTTIMNLMPDTSYQVQVRALNGETPSDWSDPSAAVKTNDLPKLSVADERAQEGNALTFTVTLTPASTATVTVRAATSIASDDTAESGDFTAVPATTLTFAAGETSKTVTVTTDEDTTDEDNETFTLTLSNASNAEISDATATGTIVNDDTPPVLSVADATAAEGSPVRFTVRLSAASGKTVTVNGGDLDPRHRHRHLGHGLHGGLVEDADLRPGRPVEDGVGDDDE